MTATQIALYVVLALTAAVFTAFTVIFTVFTLRRQRRLNYSITLVELRVNKFIYWFFDLVAAAILAACVYYMLDPNGVLVQPLYDDFGLELVGVRIVVGLLALISAEALIISALLTVSKCAVVDKGVYTPVKFMDWHHVYDFYFEPKKKTVILSANNNGPLTLDDTSPPLKYRDADYEKLKYILDKNRNKFVPRY